MSILTPTEAVNAAISVYKLQYDFSETAVNDAFLANTGLIERFELGKGNNVSFQGTTGFYGLRAKTGFGVIARGKGENNKNEALLTIRGTASKSDWITDGNCSLSPSSSGKLVHSGFNSVFKEIEPQLKKFFDLNKDVRKVHCVGHSLGGAIASMSAEWMKHERSNLEPYLYTFGSPRVGTNHFASTLTNKVKAENIYRVHHFNDIVSLIPIYPFIHVPIHGNSCCIKNVPYNAISAHFKDNYLRSVENKKWSDLKSQGPMFNNSKEMILAWLKEGGKVGAVLGHMTLSLIGSSIMYILEKAGVIIESVISAGISILDQIAFALERAWKTGKEIAGYVISLIKNIYTLVTGKVFHLAGDITYSVLRMVFELLTHAVFSQANVAIAADTDVDK